MLRSDGDLNNPLSCGRPVMPPTPRSTYGNSRPLLLFLGAVNVSVPWQAAHVALPTCPKKIWRPRFSCGVKLANLMGTPASYLERNETIERTNCANAREIRLVVTSAVPKAFAKRFV